jgi:hypothetical protein
LRAGRGDVTAPRFAIEVDFKANSVGVFDFDDETQSSMAGVRGLG